MTIGRAAARLVYAVLWWGLSLCGLWICDAVPVRDFRQVLRIVFHILLGGAVSVLWAVLAYYINLAIIPGWLPLGVGRMISTTFIGSYFYYTALVVAANGVLHFRESRAREVDTAQTERLAVEAQLQALKMELQPHFLFDTLNAISALMHRDVKSANEMLVRLADMLEAALENVRDAEVTLGEEIETVKLYLSIGGPKARAFAIAAWASETLRRDTSLDFVIAGHAHLPAKVEVEPGRYYLNAGDWITQCTYLIMAEGAAPEVQRWA